MSDTDTIEVEKDTPTVKPKTFKRAKNPSPSAFGTESTFDEEGKVLTTSYKDKGTTNPLPFTEPGLPVGNRNIYTVKAVDPAGVLVQLPLEDQINNNTASPEDFIGLRTYQRKGFTILFDLTNARGTYCPAADCWAAWDDRYRGGCSPQHERLLFAKKDNAGNFSQGVTTTRSWGR